MDKMPSYRLLKPTGLAVVTISGKDHYLGKYGTKASREANNKLIAQWQLLSVKYRLG